ncbi:MAG: hypothetical protein J6Y19_11845, partial [Kiritimatiellae bacterium]|nr:hypothetical protein [Kiritimatiellia bacterium]
GVALVAGVVVALACAVAEGADGMTASLEKVEEVVFPRVEFERAAVADVMEWMAYAAEATGMGVRVEPGALEGAPPLTLKMGGTVREILEAVGEAWGCCVELEEDGSGWVFRREEETGGAGGKGEKDAQDGKDAQDRQEAKDGKGGREAKVWRTSR